MEVIKSFLSGHVHVSDEDWQIISEKFVRTKVPKKTVLLKSGDIENNIHFLEKGIIREYIPKTESDLTFDFTFENQFFSAYWSFLHRSPNQYQMQTLTDTILWSINYDELQEIYQKTVIGNVIGRLTAEGLYINKFKRELSLLKDSAEERYLRLFEEQPRLIMQIPLKYIASYIGVTPQALSRIRRRIT